jgi:glycogen synthase
MNILYICNEYPPCIHGGIGTMTQTLVLALQNRGHTVIVAGIYDDITKTAVAKDESGTLVYRFPRYKRLYGFFRSGLRLYWEVRKIIGKHSIDIVEVPDFMGMLAYWPRLPVPVVVRLHGSAAHLLKENGDHQGSRYFFNRELRTLNKADVIIGVSKSIAAQTRNVFRKDFPISVIYNSLGIEKNESAAYRRRNADTVVFTGTLIEHKGVFSLVKAWPAVVARHPGARLHMFGKDTQNRQGESVRSLLRRSLPASCTDTVVFWGHVQRSRILLELQTADVAVFPSFSEAFGLAPLESMAMGCPTIYTTLASGPELIEDGVDGLLVDPHQPDEIAGAINRVLADKNFAAAIGYKAGETFQKRFSNDIIFSENENMYRQLIKTR